MEINKSFELRKCQLEKNKQKTKKKKQKQNPASATAHLFRLNPGKRVYELIHT